MKGLGFWGVYGQYCWLDAPCKNSGWCFKSLGVLNASGLKNWDLNQIQDVVPKKKWMPYDALQNLLEKHDAAQSKATEPEKILPAVTVHRRPGGFQCRGWLVIPWETSDIVTVTCSEQDEDDEHPHIIPYTNIQSMVSQRHDSHWFTRYYPVFSPLKHKANPLPDRTVWRCPASESRRPRERCLQGPQYDELKEMWTKCVGLASNIPIRDRNQITQMNIAYK